MSNRVVIGETERAGWPITAEKVTSAAFTPVEDGMVRWVEDEERRCYTMQQFFSGRGGWVEVKCLVRKESR